MTRSFELSRPWRLAAMAALVLSGCGPRPAETPSVAAEPGERYRVRLVPVEDLKPVAAVVAARDTAEARTRIGGTLVELRVRAGDQVRRGQLIGRVVDQRLGLETRALDAQLAAAAAEAKRAEADLARTRDLYEKGVYAKARMEQVEAAAGAARAGVAAARAQRAAGADLAGQGAVLAPADGRVLQADTPRGSVVAAGQSIATLTAGALLLRLDLPEAQARRLRVGQAVAVSADDLPGVGAAKVVQIYPAVSGGRVRVDAAAPNLSAVLVGQRVRVQLPVGERQAVVIPSRFVVGRSGADYVRLLQADGSAMDVPVQLGPAPRPAEAEVLAGLKPGDVLAAPRAAQ
jgi:RND family efflux transporter MFP subunit